MITPGIILAVIGLYFLLLLLISWYTARNADSRAYFIGNKQSPWYAVAFGLIGDSLSGVTFISVPGSVGATQFSYLQIVLGYLLGYVVIAQVLLPLYYRLNLTSIYSYLQQRFGVNAQKTGSFFFLLSRILGACFRLYLSASVLHLFIFDAWHVPFWLTVFIVIVLILLYTYRGGIKTLVWTDTLQSSFLLLGVILSIVAIAQKLDFSFGDMVSAVSHSEYAKVFFLDWRPQNFFLKQFLSGAFIAIVMTGLDQNMMQKNLSCRTLKEAQKNIYAFSSILLFVNLLFVSLGALLFIYASAQGIEIPVKTDNLFPMLAFQHLGMFAAIVFILGITAATFSSADSVLTTLTTSFCIDFLQFEKSEKYDVVKKNQIRHITHIAFAVILFAVIILFNELNNKAVIYQVFTIAGYTYGPLLGLFAFGLFTKWKVNDPVVPFICMIPPVLCYILSENSEWLLNGYQFGFELLIVNGLLTFIGLMAIVKRNNKVEVLDIS